MIRRFLIGAALAVTALVATPIVSSPAMAEDEAPLLNGNFTFDGPFGTFDIPAAQRGLQIYKEVCSNCHGLYELSYRNLAALGYNEDQIKAFAGAYQVPDLNDDGEVVQRAARASDRFVKPFPNEKAARAANNGAYPPDLALIVRAREGGANYVYSLLQGYKDAPAGFKMADGTFYNTYFSGHQIKMPQPLQDGAVTFADGSPNTLRDEAKDIVTFLAWAAEPELAERHRLGQHVMLFLIVLAGLLFYAKQRIWSDLH